MPRQNRVLPTGEIVATPERGLFMGNRGILHDEAGQLGVSRWKHKAWICCLLSFKGRRRPIMAPRRYTELFFLDEAVALAAGHRPCAECRRADFTAYRTAWKHATDTLPSAPEIDRTLHADRVRRDRRQVRHSARLGDLPDGTFVVWSGLPHLLWNKAVLPFTPAGYDAPHAVPSTERLQVLTPRAHVLILRAGYRPALHPTASV